MTEPQKAFEAMMRVNGKQDLEKNKHGKYANTSVQVRWRYFLMGWELRGTR
jgi:hypothetical protein